MSKSLSAVLAVAAVSAIASALYSWPSVYPTGTTLYDPEKAYNGYTLFTPIGSGGEAGTEPYEKPAPMYLIDMNGNVVHEWKLPFKSHHGVLLPNGNLLVNCRDEKQIGGRPGRKPYVMGGAQGWLYELDWDGNIVFQHFDPNMHHDFDKLPNGNYIYAAWEQVPKSLQKKVRGGIKGSEFDDGTMWNDYFVEINPQGKVVWEWHANDHFDPDLDTIICAGANGRVFEVTPENEIVWEYISPYIGSAASYFSASPNWRGRPPKPWAKAGLAFRHNRSL